MVITQWTSGMGAAESNMDRFANRVKKRGQSWRRYGLQAIFQLLGSIRRVKPSPTGRGLKKK
ncbi:MAG: UPF0236 family protein [Peptococcaceae bacterium MAG4]|nr:UPF0236 family protein [Peptococcaceae bacterium MAG4]